MGDKVGLSPCCLYYDHACIERGPLSNLQDRGVLKKVNADSADGPLLVEAGRKSGNYRVGCIEEDSILRLHNELFRRFASTTTSSSGSPGENSEEPTIGFKEFNEYVSVTAGEPENWEIYESVCFTLSVHPSQGLTSGDFRRMYCEFEGDLEEDHQIAVVGTRNGHTIDTTELAPLRSPMAGTTPADIQITTTGDKNVV